MPGPIYRLSLLLVLVGAATLRLSGLDWDAGQHLHPDERFIIIVQDAIRLPDSVGQYFDTANSPLNPYNRGFTAFAYGTLPLFALKALALAAGRADFDGYTEIGRAASALATLGTIGLTYLLARLLYDRLTAWLATAILACAVLDIQLAHFLAFDTFATLFVTWTLYFACRVWREDRPVDRWLLGVGLGCAVATKLSTLLLGPFVLVAGLPALLRRGWPGLPVFLVAPLAAMLTYRLAEPYTFSGPGLLDLWPNWPRVEDLALWVAVSSGQVFAPYMIQWVDTPPYLFVLGSLLRWGLGPAAGLAALAGLALELFELRQIRKRRPGPRLLLLGWVLLNLGYFGAQFAKFMRYLLPIYPGLAILAGALLAAIWRAAADWRQHGQLGWRLAGRLAPLLIPAVLLSTLLWAVTFESIYSRPHTRVAASRWLVDALPPGATLAVEAWDDALPLTVDGAEAKGFRQRTLQLYDDESLHKLNRLLGNLEQADYIILSSNRLSASIPRLPQRFPLASAYYRALFDGSLGFDLMAEFHSRPSLFGFEINDDGAQEDFTVYDHPTVQVFRRSSRYAADRVATLLGSVHLP